MSEHYRLRVNGADHDVADAWLGENLLYVLRERLGLYGSKGACEQGECGSCSVLVDGELVCSCLVLAASAVGQSITTVEGIGEGVGPTDVQQAFVDAGAVQCGFCTPGLIMAAHDLLDRIPDPAPTVIAEELSGNICRCTGYGRIVEAVQRVAVARRRGRRRMTLTESPSADDRRDRIGDSPTRPDGIAKVEGTFQFASDLPIDGAAWGATLRSPHPYARIVSIDVAPALAIPGVHAVLTSADVPGQLTYGLIDQDQPVFADGFVRYVGEPVAAVAADHPETCRRALAVIDVQYEVLTPLIDAEEAIAGERDPIHPRGNVLRHQPIRRGDPDVVGDVVVEGTYEIGMQDQAFLGLEAALAIPDHDGSGVELHIATQWLHEDRKQIAACLDMPEDAVRLVLGGVGGAFGAREDISLQVHCCLLALRLGRPVRMQYSRAESFLGHVHRHPASIWMRHHATSDGDIVKVEARFVLDGGAYASTSSAVLLNAITHTQGPYRCPNAVVDGYVARTNHLPCGAMRGFGVVQACFAHESQMDRLAEACGLDPLEIRLRNASQTGDTLITGQILESVAPVARCITETAALPMPEGRRRRATR